MVTSFYKFQCPIKPEIEKIGDGKYLHIGLGTQIRQIAKELELPEIITIDLNIDGLPLYRSSRTQLWPILAKLNNIKSEPVFAIGVFVGTSKPKSCDAFLNKFINELSYYMENGIEVTGKILNVSVRAVICDAPARAFIAGTPSHASCHGCMKCTQIAKKN